MLNYSTSDYLILGVWATTGIVTGTVLYCHLYKMNKTLKKIVEDATRLSIGIVQNLNRIPQSRDITDRL